MKKVLNNYTSKNDINIRQIVAYKDNILEIEEYRGEFSKEDTEIKFPEQIKIIKEVTKEEEYKNISLATQKQKKFD